MSALSTSTIASLPSTGTPAIDPALEPANVRNGPQAAKNAYATGLAFEQVLVNELTKEMTATTSSGDSDGLGGTSSDGSGDAGGSSGGGLMGSASATGAYSSLIPNALSTSIMSAGGTGLADQIAISIDPSLKPD